MMTCVVASLWLGPLLMAALSPFSSSPRLYGRLFVMSVKIQANNILRSIKKEVLLL